MFPPPSPPWTTPSLRPLPSTPIVHLHLSKPPLFVPFTIPSFDHSLPSPSSLHSLHPLPHFHRHLIPPPPLLSANPSPPSTFPYPHPSSVCVCVVYFNLLPYFTLTPLPWPGCKHHRCSLITRKHTLAHHGLNTDRLPIRGQRGHTCLPNA